jgi:hypothetical protein
MDACHHHRHSLLRVNMLLMLGIAHCRWLLLQLLQVAPASPRHHLHHHPAARCMHPQPLTPPHPLPRPAPHSYQDPSLFTIPALEPVPFI